MKLLSSIILTLLFVHTVDINAQFRDTKWGMSAEEIKANESATFEGTSEDGLVYSITLANLETQIWYQLIDDKLVASMYKFIESHTAYNKYLSDFNSINEILINKYGDPLQYNKEWTNDLFKDDPNNHGTALAYGHYRRLANWKTDDTVISHVIGGDNFKITHIVYYQSIELKDFAEKKANEAKEDAFK